MFQKSCWSHRTLDMENSFDDFIIKKKLQCIISSRFVTEHLRNKQNVDNSGSTKGSNVTLVF